MAKVIGYSEGVKKKFTCDNCGAIVEYVKADIREYHGTDYSGGADGQTWVVCPGCSEKYILSSW
jgi:hypothetical protein